MSHCRVLFTYLQFFQSFDWVSRSKCTAHVLIFINRRVTSHVRKYARLSVGCVISEIRHAIDRDQQSNSSAV